VGDEALPGTISAIGQSRRNKVQQTALWQVGEDGPVRLLPQRIKLEQQLEEWIERDPSLLQSGLTVVGRQMPLEAGTLDLLAVDPMGQWVVIEIKRGTVSRETIAQALDYASCIATISQDELDQKVSEYLASKGGDPVQLSDVLPKHAQVTGSEEEGRDVLMLVVGTKRDSGLERMVSFLEDTYGVPVSVVTFDVFDTPGGGRILVRETTEADQEQTGRTRSRPTPAVDDLLARADKTRIAAAVRRIHETATQERLYFRSYKNCIMYAPPAAKNRCLFTIWVEPVNESVTQVVVSTVSFPEFFPVTQEEVEQRLGGSGLLRLTDAGLQSLAADLADLMATIRERGAEAAEKNENDG